MVVASPSGASFWPRMPSIRNPTAPITRASGGGSMSTGGGGGGGGPRWRGAPAQRAGDPVDRSRCSSSPWARRHRRRARRSRRRRPRARRRPRRADPRLEADGRARAGRGAAARWRRSRCRGRARREPVHEPGLGQQVVERRAVLLRHAPRGARRRTRRTGAGALDVDVERRPAAARRGLRPLADRGVREVEPVEQAEVHRVDVVADRRHARAQLGQHVGRRSAAREEQLAGVVVLAERLQRRPASPARRRRHRRVAVEARRAGSSGRGASRPRPAAGSRRPGTSACALWRWCWYTISLTWRCTRR